VWTGDGTIEGDANFTWDGSHLLLPQFNDASTPTLAFGDGNTGFFEVADNRLGVAISGTRAFEWLNDLFQGGITGAGYMRNVDSTATVPNIGPDRADTDTGLGSNGPDQLSLIAGGVEIIRLVEGTTDYVQSQTPIFVNESASALTDIANYGQLWVKNDAPNNLYFTDDTGNDYALTGPESSIPTSATVQTTDATQTEILAYSVASGTSVGFEALIMGRQDATGDTVLEKITGLISNEAGTTALIASPDVNRHETTGASTWVVTTAADDTSDELTFDVTGEAAHTIDWSIKLTTIVI
jgi:hypothetical protein